LNFGKCRKKQGVKVNEKNNIRYFTCLVIVAIFIGGAIGFFIGGGDSARTAGLERANHKLAETVGSLRSELGRERDELERERTINARERAINEQERRIREEERKLIKSALESCGRAGGGIQGVITKMEILNGLICELERRAGRSVDLSGGE
jgi:hypothetical protein